MVSVSMGRGICSVADHRCGQTLCKDRPVRPGGASMMHVHRAALALLALVCSLASTPSRAADAALIEAARKEGKVVWYTTLIVNQAIRPLKEAFEKKYPGIELQYA